MLMDVLSRSSGRVYHVLIFNRGGRYYLDSVIGAVEEEQEAGGEGEGSPSFDSLDDLVRFLMGHDLKVEGVEVQFMEAVTCTDEAPQSQSSREFSLYIPLCEWKHIVDCVITLC